MADSPATPPSPDVPSPEAPSSRAPSATSSPTFAVRPTASTQARWPGQHRKGRTTLIASGAALGAGLLLLVLGPLLQLPGFFIGALIGLLIGVLGLLTGLIRFLKNAYAVPTLKPWQGAAIGAGFPIFISLLMEALASSVG